MVLKKKLTEEELTEKNCNDQISEWDWMFDTFSANKKHAELNNLATIKKSFLTDKRYFLKSKTYSGSCLVFNGAKRLSKNDKPISCSESIKFEKIGKVRVFTYAYGSKDGIEANMFGMESSERKNSRHYKVLKTLICKPTATNKFHCELSDGSNGDVSICTFDVEKKIKNDGQIKGVISNFVKNTPEKKTSAKTR